MLATVLWRLGVAVMIAATMLDARDVGAEETIPEARHSPSSARPVRGQDGVRAAPRPTAEAGCAFEAAGAGRVRSVTDGRSFMLDDGREIRLSGIEVPLPPAAAERGDRAEVDRGAGEAARAALAELIAGREIALRTEGVDRYGRTLAMVHRESGDVAHALLARGFARVAAQVGSLACAAALWERERIAREGKLGLWGEAYYAIRGADDLAGLAAAQGQFSVVEGRVASVRESGGTIYVNFGRRWSQALTITISKRYERMLAAAGREPHRLESRQLRVRGWLEERNGPRIEISRPEQIEIADRR